ncbi:redoxin family protein [Fimbriiglobus ruber]|uniref:Basic proline-rich protein n=1 Tax=Fimbriiglobus ruber TaxID=1908690 RepID=A0A225DCH1_9BACT|nr:thioredoxin-like domain-containing protein [Fimbriiglobus ruber]OWK39182.1 Basic proline-rich protein [Fimbriiglobus ruber]
MRLWVVLIAAGLATTGCTNLSKDRAAWDDRSPADPAARAKAQNRNWLVEGPVPPLERAGTPASTTSIDPKDPAYDSDQEMRSTLSGFVETPDGQKARDVFIGVEPVNAPQGGGASVGVTTDRTGFFMIRGLKPKQTYQLTASVTSDGHVLSGRVYVPTGSDRSQHVRISLIEGLDFGGPAPTAGPPGAAPAFPAPTLGGPTYPPARPTYPAPAALPNPVLPSGPPSVQPSGASVPRPDPLLRSQDGGTGLPFPPSADRVPDISTGGAPSDPAGRAPAPPRSGPFNDLTTEGPAGLPRPPVTSIPGPGTPTVKPPPPAGSSSGQSQFRTIRPNSEFALLDSDGRDRVFPSGRAGEFVLLDFMTTTCVPCKTAVPVMKRLQSKYAARGLDVVAVACDEMGTADRRAAAAKYKDNQNLNYLVYTEPGEQPGKVMRRFGVSAYPTLVLIDGAGTVLWKGHPNDAVKLERVLADEMARP